MNDHTTHKGQPRGGRTNAPRWAETNPESPARPREMPRYFPHEESARSATRVLLLRSRHGMEGYGVYNCLLEMLRQSLDGTIETDYDALAYELHTGAETVRAVVEDFGLFAPAGQGRVRHPAMDERLGDAATAKARAYRTAKPDHAAQPATPRARTAADSDDGGTPPDDDPPDADTAPPERQRRPDGRFLPYTPAELARARARKNKQKKTK